MPPIRNGTNAKSFPSVISNLQLVCAPLKQPALIDSPLKWPIHHLCKRETILAAPQMDLFALARPTLALM